MVDQKRINELFVRLVELGPNPGKVTPERLGASDEEFAALLIALKNTAEHYTKFDLG